VRTPAREDKRFQGFAMNRLRAGSLRSAAAASSCISGEG
jgi:hypothetical protein